MIDPDDNTKLSIVKESSEPFEFTDFDPVFKYEPTTPKNKI